MAGTKKEDKAQRILIAVLIYVLGIIVAFATALYFASRIPPAALTFPIVFFVLVIVYTVLLGLQLRAIEKKY